ncbi:MAG: hypothetical protein WKF70_03755 [Chitinophagaceae bacterium]
MKTLLFVLTSVLLAATGCTKSNDSLDGKLTPGTSFPNSSGIDTYTKFTLKKGQHFADINQLKNIDLEQMKFSVLFDSSAIYTSIQPVNQLDINKLYGFSDNKANHHQFSARIGWRWSNHALRLFAYVYNNGTVVSEEITAVTIGVENVCSIQITASEYIFTVNGQTQTLPRKSSTVTAMGYQLYPYFGGDEAAPHDVTIRIKNLK